MDERKTVLVVEDDADIRETIGSLLEFEGYLGLPTANGREALELLKSLAPERPCLILLDLMMPVMNGFQFLETFREEHSTPEIPIVVLTASRDNFPPNVNECLVKPLNTDLLLEVVKKYCG